MTSVEVHWTPHIPHKPFGSPKLINMLCTQGLGGLQSADEKKVIIRRK